MKIDDARLVLRIKSYEEIDSNYELLSKEKRDKYGRQAFGEQQRRGEDDKIAILVRRAELLEPHLPGRPASGESHPVLWKLIPLLVLGVFAVYHGMSKLDWNEDKTIHLLQATSPFLILIVWNMVVIAAALGRPLYVSFRRRSAAEPATGRSSLPDSRPSGGLAAVLLSLKQWLKPLAKRAEGERLTQSKCWAHAEAAWLKAGRPLHIKWATLCLHLAALLIVVGVCISTFKYAGLAGIQVNWDTSFPWLANFHHWLCSIVLSPSVLFRELGSIPTGEEIKALAETPGPITPWLYRCWFASLVWVVIPRLIGIGLVSRAICKLYRNYPLDISGRYFRKVLDKARTEEPKYNYQLTWLAVDYTPDDKVTIKIRELLREAFPVDEPEAPERIKSNKEPDVQQPLLQLSDQTRPLVVLQMNALDTPELVKHGELLAFVERILQEDHASDKGDSADEGGMLLVVLDETEMPARIGHLHDYEERLKDHRALWKRKLGEHIPMFLFSPESEDQDMHDFVWKP